MKHYRLNCQESDCQNEMFIIANNTSHKVTIRDIGVVIGVHQAIDLHKCGCKIKPELSKDLKDKLNSVEVRVLKKDPQPFIPTPTHTSPSPSITKKDIAEAVRDELSKLPQPIPQQSNDEVLKAVLDVKNMMRMNPSKEKPKEGDVAEINEPSNIDEVHAKAVKRMTKDSTSNISYNKENLGTSSILDDIDDLEDIA